MGVSGDLFGGEHPPADNGPRSHGTDVPQSANHQYREKTADVRFPESAHPVVRTDPETGRKALYVNRGFTTRMPQLANFESDVLLEMLFRHAEQARFHCRFKWRSNSIAFWDNAATMHQAMWDYYPDRRYGCRVTVCGDKPFLHA